MEVIYDCYVSQNITVFLLQFTNYTNGSYILLQHVIVNSQYLIDEL